MKATHGLLEDLNALYRGRSVVLRKGNNLQCVQSYSKFTATDQIVLCQAMEATIAEVTKCSTSNDNFSQKLQATKRTTNHHLGYFTTRLLAL